MPRKSTDLLGGSMTTARPTVPSPAQQLASVNRFLTAVKAYHHNDAVTVHRAILGMRGDWFIDSALVSAEALIAGLSRATGQSFDDLVDGTRANMLIDETLENEGDQHE